MKKWTLFLFIFSLLMIVGCSNDENNIETTPSIIAEVLDRGKLIVGTSSGYYPFHMRNKSGELIGYDIDTAKAIAESLNVEIEFKYFSFDGLIPALQSGKVDLVIAGMTIRGDRALAVNFSDPYYSTGQVLMVPKDDITTRSWQDLDQEGVKIAVPIGTTGALLAKQLYKKATVSDFEDITTAALAVIEGQADALMYDEPGVRIYEQKNGDKVRGIYNLISLEQLGIALPKGDLESVQWINSFLTSYKGSPKELESKSKWFMSNEWMSDLAEEK